MFFYNPDIFTGKMSKLKISRRTFPFKLWNLINSGGEIGLQWTPDGNKIVIDRKVFTQNCLGAGGIFKTSKFLSITKQLNVYGFAQSFTEHRSSSHPMYVSPFFKRDHPDLLAQFSRKPPSFKKSPSTKKNNNKVTSKKEASRPALASIGNLQENKSRTQPMRRARLTKKCKSPVSSSSSSALVVRGTTTNSAQSTPTVESYQAPKSPIILRKNKSPGPVAKARVKSSKFKSSYTLQ